MVINQKKKTRVLAILMAVIMAVTIWSAVPFGDTVYAAEGDIEISWGFGNEDENAGYLLFNYDGSTSSDELTEIDKTTVTLPDGWEFKTTAGAAQIDDSKLPEGLDLASATPTGNTIELDFDYTAGNFLFEGEIWAYPADKPRGIGTLDLSIAPTAIQTDDGANTVYTGAAVKLPIVAEAARKWELPYGARYYRELFTAEHGAAGINYFSGAKYDWNYDVENSKYWSDIPFYDYGGVYGSLNLLEKFRTQQQPTGYSCGVSCTSMVLDFWNKNIVTQSAIGGIATEGAITTLGTMTPLDKPMVLNEQDLSKIRTTEHKAGVTYDRDRDWGGPTYQDEMENMLINLHEIYGQPEWNYTSGYDLDPQPTSAPAHEQNPMLNVLGLEVGDADYDADLTMPFSEAVPWYIEHGVPVMIGWDGWGGHYETIIGYDDMDTDENTNDDVVILADSYDSVDHLYDGYLIKPWQKLVDDWRNGSYGASVATSDDRRVDRYLFLAAWPQGYDIENESLSAGNGTFDYTDDNNALTDATVIDYTDSSKYRKEVAAQLEDYPNADVFNTDDIAHAGTPYWKTDMDEITMDDAVVTKLKAAANYSDFQTIQASARNLDGPASILMSMNYFEPTGTMTDIDLAKLKGNDKVLKQSTVSDMVKIIDELNKQSVAATGHPKWDYYSTKDMNAGKPFFGEEVDETTVITTALANDVPIMTMAHEGGDQWSVNIGHEDAKGDDEEFGYSQDDVLVQANPVDIADHNPNGLSLFQYEWLIFDWGNTLADSESSAFLSIWPHKIQAQPPTPAAPADISAATVAPIKNQVYSGRAKAPAVTVRMGATTLVKGVDYNVTYTNNRRVGRANVQITGINKYAGTKLATFRINPKAAKFRSVRVGTRRATLTWRKIAGTTRYQISYKQRTAKKWRTKTISARSAKSIIKKLKKGKRYQFRIRTYKTVSKVKYYSAWSKVRTSGKVR